MESVFARRRESYYFGRIVCLVVISLMLLCTSLHAQESSAKQAKPAATRTYTQTVVHQFGSIQDGFKPTGGLIKNNAGNFYGGTYQGGLYDTGTIFEFTPSNSGGTYIMLYSLEWGDDLTSLSMDGLGNLYGTTVGGNGGAPIKGGAFKISEGQDGSWVLTNLYNFSGGYDGAFPNAPVEVDSAGNVYGVALNGGAYNGGTIFELTTIDNQWLENTLLAMGGSSTVPSYPNALIMNSAGDIYGTTQSTGLFSQGVLFKLHNTVKGWVYSIVHAFQGGPSDGGAPMGHLTFDAAGNIYGTAAQGLQANGTCCGGVYKITTSGKISWPFVFQGLADGASPSAGVIFDSTGNLYGVTSAGGGGNPDYCGTGIGYGCGVVFMLTPPAAKTSPTPWTENVLHTFTAGLDGYEPDGSLVFDDAGNIYGITKGGGNGWGIGGGGVLYELTPNPVATITTVTNVAPNPVAVNKPAKIDFSLVGLNPTGVVTIAANSGEACVAPVGSKGTGYCALEFSAAGTKTVTASYPGDTQNLASTSAGVTLQVENATTTAITRSIPDPAKVGRAVTVHFQVSTHDGAVRKTWPTGSVTVNASTGESCSARLTANCLGNCQITFSSTGSRTLVATYAGDMNNFGSVSIASAETVQ